MLTIAKKLLTRAVVLALLVAGVGAIYAASTKDGLQKMGFGKRGGGAPNLADLPVPVTGTEARIADVPVFLDGVGTARPLNTVTVKPQVDGKILKLNFKEGQPVKKGDLIAEIDPTQYKAALDQVLAKKALTQTQLDNAKRDSERYARIPGVVAQKTVDTQTALVAQLEAQLRADEASAVSSRAVLDFTKITAPLDGRTGIRQVDEGNVIRAGDAGIVTITQLQPIAVVFNLPQQQLRRVNQAGERGRVRVEAYEADGKTVLDTGMLQVVDNQVDQTTGTVKMKAEFPNATMQLWPGQFINVRLLVETLPQVVVVPTPAVQRGPNGVFIYVVGEEERVSVRPIELTQQTETESVIKSGIAVGERIVTSGFARLQDKSRVIFGRQGGEPLPPKAAPTSGQPQAGGGGAARVAKIREVCGGDLAIHCAGIERNEMRTCMAANRTKFSAPCQAVISEGDAARPANTAPAPAPTDPKAEKTGRGDGSGGGKRKRDGDAAAATPETKSP